MGMWLPDPLRSTLETENMRTWWDDGGGQEYKKDGMDTCEEQ